MSDWPTAPLIVATTRRAEHVLLVLINTLDGTYHAPALEMDFYPDHPHRNTLTDVVPVTPVPTEALDALRGSLTDDPSCDADGQIAQAAVDFINAVEALNERTMS